MRPSPPPRASAFATRMSPESSGQARPPSPASAARAASTPRPRKASSRCSSCGCTDPSTRSCARLHYLLFTPFRYPPLPRGSRFGTRRERGIWYGSIDHRTAFAEVSYYRFVFLEGTAADLGTVQTALTAFTAAVRTPRGVDLVGPPFDAHRRAIASPTSYSSSQALGAAMRAAGVEAFRYPSARDLGRGTNVGVFVPAAFGSPKPKSFETWHCAASSDRVDVTGWLYPATDLHLSAHAISCAGFVARAGR